MKLCSSCRGRGWELETVGKGWWGGVGWGRGPAGRATKAGKLGTQKCGPERCSSLICDEARTPGTCDGLSRVDLVAWQAGMEAARTAHA